jgi:signal transduction histidine kinase
VAKHAQATQVWVKLEQQEEELMLTVRDNGIGFDTTLAQEQALQGSGVGLRGMEERLRLVDGQLDIISEPGRGAEIQARIPLTGTLRERTEHKGRL